MLDYRDSLLIEHIKFFKFVGKKFFKELFYRRVNAIKSFGVCCASTLILLQVQNVFEHRIWSFIWTPLFFTSVYGVCLEGLGLMIRVAELHRVYFCCFPLGEDHHKYHVLPRKDDASCSKVE